MKWGILLLTIVRTWKTLKFQDFPGGDRTPGSVGITASKRSRETTGTSATESRQTSLQHGRPSWAAAAEPEQKSRRTEERCMLGQQEGKMAAFTLHQHNERRFHTAAVMRLMKVVTDSSWRRRRGQLFDTEGNIMTAEYFLPHFGIRRYFLVAALNINNF